MVSNTEKKIVFRVDARTQTGHGHLMRCLALAQASKTAGYSPIFLSNCDSRELINRLEAEGFAYKSLEKSHPDPIDVKTTIQTLDETAADWIVLDGYNFDFQFQKAVREAGHKLLVIDDLADKEIYDADILLNQNIYAQELSYQCNPEAILLLGNRYALLRREFLRQNEKNREIPEIAKKILVVIGGSDPHCIAQQVVQALEKINIEGPQIAISASAECKSKLESLAREINKRDEKIILFDDPSLLRGWMEWADLAISGAGSTCYELAYLGIPGFMIICAENQKLIASEMDKQGILINMGWHSSLETNNLLQAVSDLARDQMKRTEMVRFGRSLIDGQGSARIVQWMQDDIISIRKADLSDCRQIYEWSNDPLTRSVSFSTDSIPWETHEKWFRSKLSEQNSILFIASDDSLNTLGLVRFQLEDQLATASINLNPLQRGKGFGSKILRIASKRVFQETGISEIYAYIKQDNLASIKVFSKAGFISRGIVQYEGKEPRLYVLQKESL